MRRNNQVEAVVNSMAVVIHGEQDADLNGNALGSEFGSQVRLVQPPD